LIKIALENLLHNALKYSGKKETALIQVGVLDQPGSEGRVYFVRDNGAGFDMAYADKLFTPFQRLHGPQEFPGTGIGLTIVQRIITRHGGRIWPEAAVNQGATFYFTLGPNDDPDPINHATRQE
jgi:light-regulated signal transduction histidine kinase (bacteriophytochrome)